jgi:hypothetical protein
MMERDGSHIQEVLLKANDIYDAHWSETSDISIKLLILLLAAVSMTVSLQTSWDTPASQQLRKP